MALTDQCPHPDPNLNRITLPTHERFSWVSIKGLPWHRKTVLAHLGHRPDSANIHVGIILANEHPDGFPVPIKSTPLSNSHSNLPSRSHSINSDSPLSSLEDDTSSVIMGSVKALSIHTQDGNYEMDPEEPPVIPFETRCAQFLAANREIHQAKLEDAPCKYHLMF